MNLPLRAAMQSSRGGGKFGRIEGVEMVERYPADQPTGGGMARKPRRLTGRRLKCFGHRTCSTRNTTGYIVIGYDGKIYMAHKLAWFYVYGYFPETEIDHINKIRDDNRIENLREVSHSCNLKNCGVPKNSTTGIKGVSFLKKYQRYVPTVRDQNGRVVSLGSFDNLYDAAVARFNAEVKYRYPDGDSSAKKYIEGRTNE